MNPIRKRTDARKAETLPASIISLGRSLTYVSPIMGEKTVNPKAPMKKAVSNLLIRMLA
jgi:hypothetical protein